MSLLLSRDDKIRTCGLFVPNEARLCSRGFAIPEEMGMGICNPIVLYRITNAAEPTNLKDTEMLQKNLRSDQNQDDATDDAGGLLELGPEKVADLHADHGEHQGGQADDQHRTP